LLDVCKAEGWSLVQPILSSSYTGFGHGSLDRDAAELVELVHYLREHRQAERVCFVGHSTGCQDIVHFLRTQSDHALFKDNDNKSGIVRGAVLQAAVSDREQPAAVDPASYTTHLQTAETMCAQGQGEAMMPRAAFWAPMTAQRFVDLQAVGGQDDYFSSDYTDAQLTERLQAAGDWPGLRMLVAFSGADEYVAAHIDRKLLTERLTAAVNAKCPTVATSLYLEPPANHNLSQGNVGTFLEHVRQLLAKITD
jgi:pimeloyl-ACP methyl ester carboxylesterase